MKEINTLWCHFLIGKACFPEIPVFRMSVQKGFRM